MKKILIKLSLILILILALVFAEMRFLAPQRFQTRLVPISSSKIPSSFDNISIAFISDLDGDIIALEKSIEALHKTQSDIVILMGSSHDDDMSEEEVLAFDTLLASINPLYGKFALSEDESDKLKLKSLDYQVLGNTDLRIHTTSEESINLITEINVQKTDREVQDNFNLLVKTHHDTLLDTAVDLTVQTIQDNQLISIPRLWNAYEKKTTISNNTLLTHMGSNTQIETRLFSNPEIIIVTLKSQ